MLNWVFLVGGVISRDIRAGICSLPVGFRTHECVIGALVVVGTDMEGCVQHLRSPTNLGHMPWGEKESQAEVDMVHARFAW